MDVVRVTLPMAAYYPNGEIPEDKLKDRIKFNKVRNCNFCPLLMLFVVTVVTVVCACVCNMWCVACEMYRVTSSMYFPRI